MNTHNKTDSCRIVEFAWSNREEHKVAMICSCVHITHWHVRHVRHVRREYYLWRRYVTHAQDLLLMAENHDLWKTQTVRWRTCKVIEEKGETMLWESLRYHSEITQELLSTIVSRCDEREMKLKCEWLNADVMVVNSHHYCSTKATLSLQYQKL